MSHETQKVTMYTDIVIDGRVVRQEYDTCHIFFVEPLDSTLVYDCDTIANEIWSTPVAYSKPAVLPLNPPTPKSKGIRPSIYNTDPHTASKYKKTLSSDNQPDVSDALRKWLMRFKYPYPTTDQKKAIAKVVGVTHVQVSNFCNNYRKRYGKIGDAKKSYIQSSTIDSPHIMHGVPVQWIQGI